MSDDKVIKIDEEVDKRTIFRKAHNRENPYAMISKSVLRDRRLSAKAMGIMCYLLGLPDNWEISITQLATNFSDGEKSIKSGIKELVLVGYIEKYQERTTEGYFAGTVMLVHEEPIQIQKALEPSGFYPQAQKRPADKRLAEKGTLINTEDTKNRVKENNNNRAVASNEDKLEVEPDGSVVVALMERIKHLAISRVLVASWLKKHGLQYLLEKIELTETQKPNSPEGFLNKAIAQDWKPVLSRQPEGKSKTPGEPIYHSHDENVAWYNSSTNEDKLKYLQMASFKYPMFEEHLKHHKISVLDAPFLGHSLFKMMMSLLGRAK